MDERDHYTPSRTDLWRLPEASDLMVTLAMIRLMLHRLAHPNGRRLPAS
jgi:putative transposase